MGKPKRAQPQATNGLGEGSPGAVGLSPVPKIEIQRQIAAIVKGRLEEANRNIWSDIHALLDCIGADAGITFVDDRTRFLFRKAGCVWRVIFEGSAEFFIRDLDGAKYLNWLLHHPNETIAVLDLEQAVTPEKAHARARNSIQPILDRDAVKSYRKAIDELNVELARARVEGGMVLCAELERDIEKIRGQLRTCREFPDAGNLARDNVRKAIAKVGKELRNGSKAQSDFLRHIRAQVQTGYQCEYVQSEGKIWQ